MNTSTNAGSTQGSAPLGSGANDVTVAILAELATPTLYQRNGFRVLGLPADATAREISRRKQTIEKAMTHAVAIPAGSGSYFPLVPAPDQSSVREAMQSLSDPERRLVDELFWFWPHRQGGAGDDEALCRLREGKHREAEGIWLQQESEQSESSVSVHNLAILYHLKALEWELSELGCDPNPGAAVADRLTGPETEKREKTGNTDDAGKLWDKCFRRWRMLADQEEGFWSRLTARLRELEDPRLTAGMARRIRTALPSALLSICGQLVLLAVQYGRKDAALRLVETIKKSGFSDNAIREGLELAIEPVRKRIKAMCKGAEISAENDPVHADHACEQLLSDTKPLLEGLDCLLAAGHPTRDVAHDEVADRTLRCQVTFANKTNDWNRSVTLLQQALALACSESVRKKLQEQLEVVQKHVKTLDDYCGSGYYDMPAPLLEQMEKARQMADRHDYDHAVQRLEELLAGKGEAGVSAASLPLVNKSLAYCLGCRGIRRVNEALGTWDAFDTTVITAIRDRAGRKQIDDISFVCAQAQTIPQYTRCPCMACGTVISSRYSVMKYVFNKDKGAVPIIVCGTCGDRHRSQLQGVKEKLKTAVRQSAQDFVDAGQLDPANKFVEGQIPQMRKLCSSLEVSMPSPRSGKAKATARAATATAAVTAPRTVTPQQLAKARSWAGLSVAGGSLALLLLLLTVLLSLENVPFVSLALGLACAVSGHWALGVLTRAGKQKDAKRARLGLGLSYCSLFLVVVWASVTFGRTTVSTGTPRPAAQAADAAPAAGSPGEAGPSASLQGTTWRWESKGSTDTKEIYFQPGGTLRYTYLNGSTYSNATWKQTGSDVYLNFNDGYAEYTAHILGKTMTGTAHNTAGKSWNWEAFQR
jgi:hypothetical protein